MRLINLILVSFLLSLLYLHADAQIKYNLSGSFKDTTSSDPVFHLAVHLIAGPDTLIIFTDSVGNFRFNNLISKHITLFIEAGDYEKSVSNLNLEPKPGGIKLAPIFLKRKSIFLGEVTIKEKPIPIIFKVDTAEFNAGSFQTNKDDLLEDLLKNIPGISIDEDGKVFYMGKLMNELKVNGKPFFTGDLAAFLKQLPAEIISKLQIINDYGDQASFTGIKTGLPIKMLNLIIKPGMNNGKFGILTSTSGSNKQYGIAGNANYWQDTKQISLGTNLNKTNDISGEFNTNSIAASYRDTYKQTITLAANYSYTNSVNNADINSFSQSIINTAPIYNETNSNNTSNSNNHVLRFDLRYQPNSNNYLIIDPALTLTSTKNNTQLQSSQTGLIIQNLNQRNQLQVYQPALSGTLDFMHRFVKPGRTIAITIDLTNNNRKETNLLLDSILYINSIATKDSLLNRFINMRNTDKSYGIKASYSEPVSQRASIDILLSANKDLGNSTFVTDNLTGAGNLNRIDSLSNVYTNSFTTYVLNADYRYGTKKFRLITGTSFQSELFKNNTFVTSHNQTLNTHTYNISPVLDIFYLISAQNTLSLNYNTSSEAPGINELNPITNTTNIQNAIVGNPKLSPSFTHRISIEFNHANLNGGSLNLNLGANVVQKKIVTNTILIPDTLNSVKQETHYLNVNGFYTLNSGYHYSIPVVKTDQVESDLNLTGNIEVDHNIYFTNNLQPSTQNIHLSQSASILFKIKHLGIGVTSAYSKSTNQTIEGSGINTSLNVIQLGLSGNYSVTSNLTMTANCTKTINSGAPGYFSTNPLIINASIKQTFFKKQTGSVQLQAFDLLNQSNNLSSMVIGNTVVDSRVKYITSYFKLTISMRLSNFGNKK